MLTEQQFLQQQQLQQQQPFQQQPLQQQPLQQQPFQQQPFQQQPLQQRPQPFQQPPNLQNNASFNNNTQPRIVTMTNQSVCHNCKKPGHQFRNCNLPQKQPFCYHCGLQNVMTTNCPRCNSGNGQ
jgi:hypothetical protein